MQLIFTMSGRTIKPIHRTHTAIVQPRNLKNWCVHLITLHMLKIYATNYTQTPIKNTFLSWCKLFLSNHYQKQLALFFLRSLKGWANTVDASHCKKSRFNSHLRASSIHHKKLSFVICSVLPTDVVSLFFLEWRRCRRTTGFIEESSSLVLSYEVLGGVTAALVFLEIVIISVPDVFFRKRMAGVLSKGVLRNDIYNESAKVTDPKVSKTDSVLTNTDNGKWLSSNGRTRAFKF